MAMNHSNIAFDPVTTATTNIIKFIANYVCYYNEMAESNTVFNFRAQAT